MTTQHPEAEWRDEITQIIYPTNEGAKYSELTLGLQREIDQILAFFLAKLKSAEIEGRANEALAMVFLVDIEKYPEANKIVAERSLELEAQLKTIKGADNG